MEEQERETARTKTHFLLPYNNYFFICMYRTVFIWTLVFMRVLGVSESCP